MIAKGRAKKEKNKRLGSKHAVDLGGDDFFLFFGIIDLFVRSGLPVLIDLIVGEKMAR